MNAWGYAEVLASSVVEPEMIPRGSYVWGYLPLGTLAQDLEVRLHPDHPDAQFFVTSKHREGLMPIYNRYFIVCKPGSGADLAMKKGIEAKTPELGFDVLVRVMHTTAFLLSGFVFSPDTTRVIDGSIGPDDETSPTLGAPDAWSAAAEADLTDATLLFFAPGSKVAVIFASLLRARRKNGRGGRPRTLIGVSSESSKAFTEGTGVYHSVVTTSADPGATLQASGHEAAQRVVIFDFGGRAGAGLRWAGALSTNNNDASSSPKETNTNPLYVGVGFEIYKPSDAEAILAAAPPPLPFKVVRLNADDMRRRAIKKVGEKTYFAEEAESWDRFQKEGIKGLTITWGEGMDDLAKGWDILAKGEVLPSEGLAYKL
ncbi:hypothetical protein F5Y17DRAFT_28039 [Xylariaceae sp. FL0594]|nr:hypothetical protein F5Y17DRAFT_28039 [Xylariaceae sp. FL0594]